MNVFSELNQANNRNGDLLTEISRLQAENAKLRAQSDAKPRPDRSAGPDSKLEELVSRWEALKDGGGPSAPCGVLQDELLTIISLARKGLTAPPRPDTSAGLIETVLTFEPYLADEGFGKERSLKWMVEHFYRTHLPEEKAKNVTERYLAAIRARAADRNME